MPHANTIAVILAAGKGTRMHSDKPKVLQTLLGESMLSYVAAAASSAAAQVLTVVGHGQDMVARAHPELVQGFVPQTEQKGTGHALQVAWDKVRESGAAHCLVLNGDAPLVTPEDLEELLGTAREGADIAFLTSVLPDAGAFGRVLRGADGAVTGIVEAKDYDPAAARRGHGRGEHRPVLSFRCRGGGCALFPHQRQPRGRVLHHRPGGPGRGVRPQGARPQARGALDLLGRQLAAGAGPGGNAPARGHCGQPARFRRAPAPAGLRRHRSARPHRARRGDHRPLPHPRRHHHCPRRQRSGPSATSPTPFSMRAARCASSATWRALTWPRAPWPGPTPGCAPARMWAKTPAWATSWR